MSNKGSTSNMRDVGSSRRRQNASVFESGVRHDANSTHCRPESDKVTACMRRLPIAVALCVAGMMAAVACAPSSVASRGGVTSPAPLPSASGSAQQPATVAAGGSSTTASAQLTRPPNPHDVLYPGDIVRLKIWREPDLSGDYDVNVHGEAVFPKIGTLHVTDMTVDSLQRLLVSTYSEYLKNPAIEITPLRRVTVLGAVKNPGLYPVDPTMSVADAIALAGGATPDGNQKRLELIRNGKKQNVAVTTSEQIGTTEIRSGDELFIPERSWIARNGYIVGAVIGAVAVFGTTLISLNHGF
jgi:protein involved in polysaccharide export with SLBB domain